jgi:microcystin-dependent protein
MSKSIYWLIIGIIICLTFVYWFKKNTENMENVNVVTPTIISEETIRQGIKNVYDADISAIKNLSNISGILKSNGSVKIPGKLTVLGEKNELNHLNVIGETNLNKLTATGEINMLNNLNIQNKLNITGKLLVSSEAGNVPFMQNIIVMWSGSDIPKGWVLCDGNNGTPNLTDRFIIGASNSIAVGATGGSASQILTPANIPPHNHAIGGTISSDMSGSSYCGQISIDRGGSTTKPAGGSQPINTLPPYYVLAYIMKL